MDSWIEKDCVQVKGSEERESRRSAKAAEDNDVLLSTFHFFVPVLLLPLDLILIWIQNTLSPLSALVPSSLPFHFEANLCLFSYSVPLFYLFFCRERSTQGIEKGDAFLGVKVCPAHHSRK